MRRVSLLVAAAVAVASLAACGPKTVECKDGTHSTSTGRGACSHHGGVKLVGGSTNSAARHDGGS